MFKSFMKKLRLAVTIIVGILIVFGVFAFFASKSHQRYIPLDVAIIERCMAVIFTCVCLAVMGIIVYFWYGKDHKCPACNSRFSLRKIGEEVARTEDIYVQVKAERVNRFGEHDGYQEQYVPGEKTIYKVHKKCKKCGHVCYGTRVEKAANI